MLHLPYNFKHRLLVVITLLSVCVFFINSARGPIRAGEGGRTGAPFDSSTCGAVGCHHGGAFHTTLTVTLQTTGGSLVTTYIPGTAYNLHISFVGSVASLVKYGFQTVCVDSATNANINGWGTVPTNTHDTVWNGRNYVEQTASLTSGNIVVPWTAPASGTGTVKFYVSGCVVNGNLLPTGDSCMTTSIVISEDHSGCIPPTLSAVPTGITCYGDSTGAITLSATGGSGVSGYSWAGPGGFTATTANISGLIAGTYTVIVNAAGGCSDTTTATVVQPATALSVSPGSNGPICPGGTVKFWSGTAGGTPLYSYSWTGPVAFVSATDSNTITGWNATDTGSYSITVIDDNGCSTTSVIDLALAPVPIDSLSDTVVCIGTPITLNAGNTGDSYLWSTSATTQTISISDTGYYWVSVTNTYNCVANDTIHVSLNCPSLVNNLLLKDIEVYPNPTRNQVSISATVGVAIGHLQICSVTGLILIDQFIASDRCTINIGELLPGNYMLRIVNESTTKVELLEITP
jgi:hypothetical protein